MFNVANRGAKSRVCWLLAAMFVGLLVRQPPWLVSGIFILACLLPILNKSGVRRLDPVLLVSVPYLLAFPVSSIFSEITASSFRWNVSVEALEMSLQWGALGFTALLLGYYLRRRRNERARRPNDASNSTLGRRTETIYLMWAGLIGLMGMLASLLLIPEGQYVFIESASSGGGSTLGMLSVSAFLLGLGFITHFVALTAERRTASVRWLFRSLLSVYLVIGMGSGGKSILFGCVLSVILGSLLSRQKVTPQTIALIVGGAIAVFLLFDVVATYRSFVRADQWTATLNDPLGGATYRVRTFGEAVIAVIAGEGGEASSSAPGRSAHVLSRLGSARYEFASLLTFTQFEPPLLQPLHSAITPVYALIPRAAFPQKPTFFDAGSHARMYGWSFGGISVSLIGSIYMAWGYIGIVVAMGAIGWFLASLLTMADGTLSRNSLVATTTVAVLVYEIAYTGTTVQAVLTNVVRTLLLAYLGVFIASRLAGRKALN